MEIILQNSPTLAREECNILSLLHAIAVLSPAPQAGPYPLPPARHLALAAVLCVAVSGRPEMFPITARAITVQA